MRKKMMVGATLALVLAILAPAAASPARLDRASMQTLPGFTVVEGSSASLVATGGHATITVRTSGLVPGNVYTLWGFSFSYPENCVEGCGFDDVARDPAGIGFSVQQIAGHVTGESGKVNFGGSIAVANAQGAEYHVVIAEHGALDPADMPNAIKSGNMNNPQIAFLGG
jgi:hypothetical protein